MKRAELVKKALKNATPAQLIRVRAILSSIGEGCCGPAVQAIKDRTLKAFDAEQYDHEDILWALSDKELGEALR